MYFKQNDETISYNGHFRTVPPFCFISLLNNPNGDTFVPDDSLFRQCDLIHIRSKQY